MKSNLYLPLAINLVAICLLVYVVSFGVASRTTLLENGVLNESLHLTNLMLIPILGLIYNSYLLIKNDKKSQL